MKRTYLSAGLIVATALTFGCSKSPTEVARSFSEALAKGKVSEAQSYATEPVGRMLDNAMSAGLVEVDPDAQFIVVEEAVDSNEATVKYKKNQDSDTQGLKLVKIDGKWKVSEFIAREGELKIQKARADVSALSTAIQAFNMIEGKNPQSLSELSSGSDPYLTHLPLDPWGNAYQYSSSSTRRGLTFEVYSTGEDTEVSYDDIGNWED